MCKPGVVPPVPLLSFSSPLHGIVYIHSRSLAERMCKLNDDGEDICKPPRKQIRQLDQLITPYDPSTVAFSATSGRHVEDNANSLGVTQVAWTCTRAALCLAAWRLNSGLFLLGFWTGCFLNFLSFSNFLIMDLPCFEKY